MANQENKNIELIDNVITQGTFLRIPYINWAEAIIASAIVVLLIKLIPFVPSIQYALMILLGAATFAIFLRGLKNRSFSQIVLAEIIFKHKRRRLHLRAPNYKKSKKVEVINNESYLETVLNHIKRANDNFIEKHRSN